MTLLFSAIQGSTSRENAREAFGVEEVGMGEKKRHGWARTILLKDDRILL